VPSRWTITLAGAAGDVPVTAPMAVVAGWLDDPPEAQPSANGALTVPHEASRRPWALTPPRRAKGPDGEPITEFGVRLLDDALPERLLTEARPGRSVRLGRAQLSVVDPPRLMAHASWEQLAAWSGARAWQLNMLTPTTFRQRNRTTPWPAPDAVARGLLHRWRLLDPETAPAATSLDTRHTVWVSDLDGHSEVADLKGQVLSGFLGRVRYSCDGPAEEACLFDAVISLAAYAGIGSHTTFGFGTVIAEPTWQPPSIRPRRP
jgi:CRISPR-associated endoribonuclease Cas6